MRNIEITEIRSVQKEFVDHDDDNHIITDMSYLEEQNGVAVAKFVVSNLRITAFNRVVPWDNNAQRIFDEYMSERFGHNEYHIALVKDCTNSCKWVEMFDAFYNQINVGDYVWVNVRTVDDLYKFGSFSSFRRLTSEIYIMRKGWDVL